MIQEMKAAIFDLDGVIVDTAKYHYLAWKRLANSFNFDLTEKDNERLKGVSRQQSLEILLEIGQCSLSADEKENSTALKNGWYVEYIQKLEKDEILPGVSEYILRLRQRGVKTAIGSASKNTPLILQRLEIEHLFDAIVDGNKVQKAKPDPEVFLRAAEELDIPQSACVVFEDAEAGIQAAASAGMGSVGIGDARTLYQADIIIKGIWQLLIL